MIRVIKKYSKNIQRVLLFLLASIVVIYIFPRQGKFRYEYSQGKPWKHSTLIAPFDFPIYKTAEELKSEEDDVLVNFKPYFKYHNDIQKEAIGNFIDFNSKKRKNIIKKYPFLTKNLNDSTVLYDNYINYIVSQLEKIYSKGIYSIPDNMSDVATSSIIILVKNNFAESFELSEFYNYQTSYQALHSSINIYLSELSSITIHDIDNLINEFELNRYLTPNILFDEERSNQERADILTNISLTEGVVLSGQKIIDTGDIITLETRKILDSFKKEYESSLGRSSGHYFIVIAQSIIIMVVFAFILLFLFFFRKDVYRNMFSIIFLLIMIVSMILLARMAHLGAFPIYIIPFTILPIIIRIFFDSRLAFFAHVSTVLLAAFFAQNSFEFVFIQIPAGLAAMFSLFKMVRRSQLVRAAFIIVLTYSIFYTALSLWQEADISNINFSSYWQFLINGGLILLIYPLIYVFEKIFGFLSDVTLVELSDTNHPLLRRLAEKAPGTFQHSIQVGNLAQDAVYAIGGNPLLVRAGAMYHDIGKLNAPYFFTENQAGNINPHDEMSFDESAQIIISHVTDGIKMAQKENLPKPIIDFISTHHGTAKTWYFYNSFINANPDIEPDEMLFTYPGPTPSTKEEAVLMMADSVEAASRSLKNHTEKDIDSLVEGIIDKMISENQFNNAPITFKDISTVKQIFKNKLKNIYHARIEYPKINKSNEK